MTETKQEKPIHNSIPKPISQAFLAGGGAGTFSLAGSLFFEVPGDQAFKMASGVFLAGAGISLYLSWQDSRHETRPKKRKSKGRSLDFNHARGTTKIYPDNLEFSTPDIGGTLVRETYPQAIWRKVKDIGNPSGQQKKINPVERPKIFDEFIFHSHYQGQIIQLREKHVKLFLASAYRNRPNGKGLSIRHWERKKSQRPAWFQELHPLWYRGMSMLLWNAQKYLDRQLVITLKNQQSFLAVEPRELFGMLKWYEYNRRKK